QHGMPPIDAWIPDSTLWVNQARAMPQGAQVVQTTGVHVALSPLMIVMPQSVADGLGPVAKSIGWNFLLPQTAGGPPAAEGVKVELPDPKLSAAGLATVIEVNRLLGTNQAAGENFTRFAFGADETEQYDNPAALTSLIALSKPPLNERTVTVASEQSVIQFDQTHKEPLAARYPSDGSPELDYPYVLTTTNPDRQRAAQEFGKIPQQDLPPPGGARRRLPARGHRRRPHPQLVRPGRPAAERPAAGRPEHRHGHPAGLGQGQDRHPHPGHHRHVGLHGHQVEPD